MGLWGKKKEHEIIDISPCNEKDCLYYGTNIRIVHTKEDKRILVFGNVIQGGGCLHCVRFIKPDCFKDKNG